MDIKRLEILLVSNDEENVSTAANVFSSRINNQVWRASTNEEFNILFAARDYDIIIYFFIPDFNYQKAWEKARQSSTSNIIIKEQDFPCYSPADHKGCIITDVPGLTGLVDLFTGKISAPITEPQKGEVLLRNILEKIPNGIILLSRDWEIIFINSIAEEFLQRPFGTLTGKNIWEEFPGAREGITYKSYKKSMDTNEPLTIEDFSPILGRYIQSIVVPTPDGLIIYFHDLTRQKYVEQGLKESEDKFRILLDRITDGFIALDKDFKYIYANQKIGKIIKRDPATLIGKNVWEEFPDAVDSFTYKAFQTAMKEQRFISIVDYYQPLNLWQENYIYPSPDGLSVFIKDVSEQKKLERKLKEKERKQQLEIITTSMKAQEKERTFIGRELHDNVNQIVTATKLLLSLLRDNPSKHKEVIHPCINNLDKVINENRKLAHSLVTPDFSSGSFIEELSNLVLPMLESKGINTKVESRNFRENILNDVTKLAAYRIAQEQCTNIIKYAKAANVRILLQIAEKEFEMIISDDGSGMSTGDTGSGIGIKNMEGRLKVLNGRMEIKTAQGEGFHLKISVPIEADVVNS